MVGEDPFLQTFDGEFFVLEAGQVALAQNHHLHQQDDLLSMLLDGHKSLLQKVPELLEAFRLNASEHLHHLCCKFEGCLFESESFARGVREEKAEIDVEDVALDIDKDVPIVPVFEGESIADERVSGKGNAEIVDGLLEF